MTSYNMNRHECKEKIKSVNSDKDIWQIYECEPLRQYVNAEKTFELWVHFDEEIPMDEHGVYINFCPFCGYQPKRLSEKTPNKGDAIV